MQPRHRPLLPANERPPESEIPSSSRLSGLRKRRKPIAIACETCRRRKVRCDGRRPDCTPCASKKRECRYPCKDDSPAKDADPLDRAKDTGAGAGANASDAVAGPVNAVTDIVRTVETTQLEHRVAASERENAQLRELFRLMATLPEHEAQHVFTRIRTIQDPDSVLSFAKAVSMPFSDPRCSPSTISSPSDPRLLAMDMRALQNSSFRVSARPWTTLAGDGTVSALISSFFAWDQSFFYPFIDRDAFLDDMRSGDVDKATYCSPFLVNAICATRCYTSGPAKSFCSTSGQDLSAAFLNEAKKLWSLENGRATLPTVQGLALIFTVSAYKGADRAGMMYRYAAYEMLQRLDLPGRYKKIEEDPKEARQRRILSQALWGLFCFESILAYVYLQQSLIPPPTIPRLFESSAAREPGSQGNLDIYGDPWTDKSRSPPFVPGALDASCDLSELLYEVMQWNSEVSENNGVGSEEDMSARRRHHKRVLDWREQLAKRLREDENFTPQTCFLRIYMEEVIISILRPLHHDTVFDQQGLRVKDMLKQCALTDASLMETYVQRFSLADYSCMALCGMYNALLILVPFLGDPQADAALVRVCAILRRTAWDYPMARFILQGAVALAWTHDVTLPVGALPYLQSLGGSKEELRDIPVAFAMPTHDTMSRMLNSSNDGVREDCAELGTLLSKWSALCIE